MLFKYVRSYEWLMSILLTICVLSTTKYSKLEGLVPKLASSRTSFNKTINLIFSAGNETQFIQQALHIQKTTEEPANIHDETRHAY